MLIAVAYGLFNSIGLHRAEKQVTWETLGLLIFLTVASSAVYCLRASTIEETSGTTFSYFHLIELFHQNRKKFEWALASVVILFAMFLSFYLLPNPRVEAASINIQLSRAIGSLKSSDMSTINEVVNVFNTATTDRVFINPRLMNVAGKKVTEAYQENPGAWPAAIALQNYHSSLNKKTSPQSPQSCLSVSGIIIDSVTITGCPAQILDNITWWNVVFEDSTIIYHGGHSQLKNVQFKNCQFILDYTPGSQKLAKALTTSETVTITLPGNSTDPSTDHSPQR